MGVSAYALLLRLIIATIIQPLSSQLSKSLGRRYDEKQYPDVSAPNPYIMGVIFAEVSPSPAWILSSTPLLLSSSSNERYSLLLSLSYRPLFDFDNHSPRLHSSTIRALSKSSNLLSFFILTDINGLSSQMTFEAIMKAEINRRWSDEPPTSNEFK